MTAQKCAIHRQKFDHMQPPAVCRYKQFWPIKRAISTVGGTGVCISCEEYNYLPVKYARRTQWNNRRQTMRQWLLCLSDLSSPRPHRMRTIASDDPVVCQSVSHVISLCKRGWTDRDLFWVEVFGAPVEVPICLPLRGGEGKRENFVWCTGRMLPSHFEHLLLTYLRVT